MHTISINDFLRCNRVSEKLKFVGSGFLLLLFADLLNDGDIVMVNDDLDDLVPVLLARLEVAFGLGVNG